MKNFTKALRISAAYGLILLSLLFATAAFAQPSDKNIASQTKVVDGLQLHYLTAGHGPYVILLHGYAETSRMWRPLMPILAERFTVIAPDLPGIGDSAIPSGTRCRDMRSTSALARSLGVEKWWSDLMSADGCYAYAAQFLRKRKD
jgi:pimeloyl-ACP methyl ester carboxylesterase